MDFLENYHLFAQRVCKAMNAGGVKPLGENRLHAVMVIVAGDEKPSCGAIEWDGKLWHVEVKMLEVTPA